MSPFSVSRGLIRRFFGLSPVCLSYRLAKCLSGFIEVVRRSTVVFRSGFLIVSSLLTFRFSAHICYTLHKLVIVGRAGLAGYR